MRSAEHSRPVRVRLSHRHRRWTYAACFAVLGTGVLWLGAHYLLARDCEFGACRNPLEPWILRLHGAAAFAALVAVGALLPVHVTRAWRMRQNRPAGALVLLATGLLIASGYGLYYVADEAWRPPLSLTHWILGLALIPVFAVHRRLGRGVAPGGADASEPPVSQALHGRRVDAPGGRKKTRHHAH